MKPIELADHPDCPKELVYLWSWFCDICGEGRVSFTELFHWSQLTKHELTPFEVDVIRKLDTTRLKVMQNE